MLIPISHPISRRTLLQAGGLLCVSSCIPFLSGCGGGSENLNDQLPQGYGEAYTRVLTDDQGNYYSSQIIGITPSGDILFSEFGSPNYPLRELHIARYKDRALPEAARSRWVLPKQVPESADYVIAASPSGEIYLSRFLVDDVPTDGTRDEFAILTAEGERIDTITLADSSGTGYGQPYFNSLTIAPNGDCYCAGELPIPDGNSTLGVILRWDRTGKFIQAYNGKGSFQLYGLRIAFAPDGSLRTLGYDSNVNPILIAPDDENQPSNSSIPIRTKGDTGYQLQIDGAGNIYFLSGMPGTRSAVTRNDPPPRSVYLRKFSPTGVELAAVEIGRFHGAPSFAVDQQGNVYTLVGSVLHAFRRTR